MMTTPVQTEARLYSDVWTSVRGYGQHAPGEVHAPMFHAIAQPAGTVLDAGCGNGRGALALQTLGYMPTLCDVTDAGLEPPARALPFTATCLWHDLTPLGSFDWVYCCDVLEHIPTEYTMLTIARLLAVARRGAFFSIGLLPDAFGVWVGKPLHQTVRDFTWWRDRLRDFGTVDDARDCLASGLFLVRPR